MRVVDIRRGAGDKKPCDEQTQARFDHLRTQQIFGASVFSVRPSTALLATVEAFISYWQIKRDQSKRGIIEVRLEEAQ